MTHTKVKTYLNETAAACRDTAPVARHFVFQEKAKTQVDFLVVVFVFVENSRFLNICSHFLKHVEDKFSV